jgi:hypothetical protein
VVSPRGRAYNQVGSEHLNLPKTSYDAQASHLPSSAPQINCLCNSTNLRTDEQGSAIFEDTRQAPIEGKCNNPFFTQYAVPCVPLLKLMGNDAVRLFHPRWVVNDMPTAEPAIVHEPWPEARATFSLEARKRGELATMLSELQGSLYDIEIDKAISFVRKFQDMVRRDDLNPPPPIQDPPVVRSRGRPKKTKKKNLFRGGQNIA